ncbi:MAG: copper resistance protein NlpE N-terminal domain-containing protein [Lutibacter sp.]|jgi:heat shock protein HslJ|nr:copper resistance protein NlpE N-terminal domain-containing protein [Lutibacter sp.]MDP3946330.1 copper resistance protein NlpE N-terminal domain-containing protein [Lutibacter sp.]
MKKQFLFITLILFTIISACNSNPKPEQNLDAMPDNSLTSLDWPGIYRGVLPCADCEGVETEIKINADLTYVISSTYLGKNEEAFKKAGSFKWDEAGAKITLENVDPNASANQFLVGENMLFKLDADGNRIEGDLKEMYQLKKVYLDSTIAEKYWKLIELNGKKIILGKNQNTAPHLTLKNENSRVFGNGGCNTFQGAYELEEGNKIKFSKIGSTKMFCDYMGTEQALLQVLEKVENYSVENDTVSLNNPTMVSLAKFQMIYAK